MKTLTVVGIGQGTLDFLSGKALNILHSEDNFILQSKNIPLYEYLRANNKKCFILDDLFKNTNRLTGENEKLSQAVIDICNEMGQAILLVLGQGIIEFPTYQYLEANCLKNNIELMPVAGVSLADAAISVLNEKGYRVGLVGVHAYNIIEIDSVNFDINYTNVITGVNSIEDAKRLKTALIKRYPDNFRLYIVAWRHFPIICKNQLSNIDKNDIYSNTDGTCFVIEPVEFEDIAVYRLPELLQIMEILRSENGCPWDKQQTYASLRVKLIEECYEVLEAVEFDDKDKISEELGDVLYIILLYAQIAKEKNDFTMLDIIDDCAKKYISRHTHVFAGKTKLTVEQVHNNWEEIKKIEKNYESQTAELKSVPKQFPALMRSAKVLKRAQKTKKEFSSDEVYENLKAQITKLGEETELSQTQREDIIGNILFDVSNIAVNSQIDAEKALADATDEFIDKFEQDEIKEIS